MLGGFGGLEVDSCLSFWVLFVCFYEEQWPQLKLAISLADA